MRDKDQFDLINANNDYMDFNIAGEEEEGDSIPEMDIFFAQQQQTADEDGSIRKRRTHAFNEIDDNIDFNEFTNVDEDDGQFGEIGANGKVIANEDSDGEEAEDQVGDLDFEDSKKDFMFDMGDRR